jgi:hypothetical protein
MWVTTVTHMCLTSSTKDFDVRLYTLFNDGGPPGTRTPNLRIKSPQLCH